MINKQIILAGILAALIFAVAGLVTLISAPPAEQTNILQVKLPTYLREASGLARLPGGDVLTHNDEKGVVYSVSMVDFAISPRASLGAPAMDGDFEGITLLGERIYLVTSTGEIFDFAFDDTMQEAVVEPDRRDSGLKDICEIEGLAHVGRKLLLPCKTSFVDEHKKKLTVFEYSLDDNRTGIHFSLDKDDLVKPGKIHPTAIEVTDTHYYVITGNRLLVLEREGFAATTYKLKKNLHFQPEGIAVLDDGRIVIVDDNKKGTSRMTRYEGLHELEVVAP